MEPSQSPRPSRSEAESALERVATDAEWLALLRAAYRGRHEVLDALWWAAHPGTSTPSGREDPADRLAELQRAAFSRDTLDSPAIEVEDPASGVTLRMREVERSLWEAQRRLAEDARSLEQALSTVQVPRPSSSHAFTAAPAPSIPSGQPPATAPRAAVAAARARFLIPVLIGMALLIIVFVVPSLSSIGAGGEPTRTATTQASTPEIQLEVTTVTADGNVSDPLALLERAPTEGDQPKMGFGDTFHEGSFRKLPDIVGHLQLFLARGAQDNSICLMVVRAEGGGGGSCMGEDRFLERGIDFRTSGGEQRLGPEANILSESFTLLANGDFHYEATVQGPSAAPGSAEVSPIREEPSPGR